MRRLVVLLLVLTLLNLGAFALPARAGGTQEIAIGTLLGAGMGVATGGAALLFSPNNETGDSNMDTFLWVGAGVGAAGGFVMGTFIPEGAELSAGLRLPQRWGATFLRWPSPYVAPVKLHDEQGVEIGARLIDLAF